MLAGVGWVGTLTLPYVSMITSLIGQGINSFTTLQPILMSILIAMSFSEDLTAEFYETTVEEMSQLQETDSSALLYFVIGNDKYNDAGVPRTRIVDAQYA